MRFYFTQPGDPQDDGIDFPDADAALREAAAAALAIARDQKDITREFRLEVSSDQGPVGSVRVQVVISHTNPKPSG